MKKPVHVKDTTCNFGIMLIIVGYISFSNYEQLGDVVILMGTFLVLISKFIPEMEWSTKPENQT